MSNSYWKYKALCKCTACGGDLDIPTNKTYCKKCYARKKNRIYKRDYKKEYKRRNKDPKKKRLIDRNYRKRNSDKLAEIKKNKLFKIKKLVKNIYGKEYVCCYCGEKEEVVLQFHHKDRKNKKFIISSYGFSKKRTLDELKYEISKCILLCSNCHIKLHRGIIKEVS